MKPDELLADIAATDCRLQLSELLDKAEIALNDNLFVFGIGEWFYIENAIRDKVELFDSRITH